MTGKKPPIYRKEDEKLILLCSKLLQHNCKYFKYRNFISSLFGFFFETGLPVNASTSYKSEFFPKMNHSDKRINTAP